MESALEWCLGKVIGCHKFTSFEEAFGFVDPYPGGKKCNFFQFFFFDELAFAE